MIRNEDHQTHGNEHKNHGAEPPRGEAVGGRQRAVVALLGAPAAERRGEEPHTPRRVDAEGGRVSYACGGGRGAKGGGGVVGRKVGVKFRSRLFRRRKRKRMHCTFSVKLFTKS